MAKTNLYRFFDASGNLLYIGVSISVVQRLQGHLREKHWIPENGSLTWTTYETREAAEAAERIAIRHERPAHNVIHSLVKPLPQAVRYERPGNVADLAGHCVRHNREVVHYRLCKMTPGGFNACHFEKTIIAWGFCCRTYWQRQINKAGYRATMMQMLRVYNDSQDKNNPNAVSISGKYQFEPPIVCSKHKEGA